MLLIFGWQSIVKTIVDNSASSNISVEFNNELDISLDNINNVSYANYVISIVIIAVGANFYQAYWKLIFTGLNIFEKDSLRS